MHSNAADSISVSSMEYLPGLGDGVKNLISVSSGVNVVISAQVVEVISFERRLTVAFVELHRSLRKGRVNEGLLDVVVWIVFVDTHLYYHFFFLHWLSSFGFFTFSYFSLSRRDFILFLLS
jgi:hypothetical protein